MSQLLTCTSSTRPSDVRTGDLLFETDTNRLIFWDGVVWRIYNSDRSLPGTGGEDELHYPAGIWSNASSTYFVNTQPLFHFDSEYVDGATATDHSGLDGDLLSNYQNGSAAPENKFFWKSRVGDYVVYSASAGANFQLAYNGGRKGIHARQFYTGSSASNAQLNFGKSSSADSEINVKSKNFTYFLIISSNSQERSLAIPNHGQSSGDPSTAIVAGMGNGHNRIGGEVPNVGAVHTMDPADNGDPMIIIVRGNSSSIDGWVFGSPSATISGTGGRMIGASHSNDSSSNPGKDLPVEYAAYNNSGQYWNGVFHEMILFSSALSKAETNKITQYLCNKYDQSFVELNIT